MKLQVESCCQFGEELSVGQKLIWWTGGGVVKLCCLTTGGVAFYVIFITQSKYNLMLNKKKP